MTFGPYVRMQWSAVTKSRSTSDALMVHGHMSSMSPLLVWKSNCNGLLASICTPPISHFFVRGTDDIFNWESKYGILVIGKTKSNLFDLLVNKTQPDLLKP